MPTLLEIREKLRNYHMDEETRLTTILQRDDSDLAGPYYFDFYFKPGHHFSERLKTWFEEHRVDYFVAEQNQVGGTESGGVSFRDRPDLAVLFKLTFHNV